MNIRKVGFALVIAYPWLLQSCHVLFPFDVVSAPSKDSHRDEAVASDAGADLGDQDAEPIDPLSPFGTPVPVVIPGMDPLEADDPSMSPDLLELCFDRGGNLWCARRETPISPWGPAVQILKATTAIYQMTNPRLDTDGLSLYLTLWPKSSNARDADLYVSRRTSLATIDWSEPSPMDGINRSDWWEGSLSTMNGGRYGVLHICPSAVGYCDTYFQLASVERPSVQDLWQTPVPLGLAKGSYTSSPSLSPSGLVLYFVSSMPGGQGGWDIWVSMRQSLADPFGPPRNVASLNSADHEPDIWVSADQHHVMFTRGTSPNTPSEMQLYEASR